MVGEAQFLRAWIDDVMIGDDMIIWEELTVFEECGTSEEEFWARGDVSSEVLRLDIEIPNDEGWVDLLYFRSLRYHLLEVSQILQFGGLMEGSQVKSSDWGPVSAVGDVDALDLVGPQRGWLDGEIDSRYGEDESWWWVGVFIVRGDFGGWDLSVGNRPRGELQTVLEASERQMMSGGSEMRRGDWGDFERLFESSGLRFCVERWDNRVRVRGPAQASLGECEFGRLFGG